MNDLPEVSTEAKKLMSIHGEITTSRQPLCVEIYLRTADDDVMTLETWCIGVSLNILIPVLKIKSSLEEVS